MNGYIEKARLFCAVAALSVLLVGCGSGGGSTKSTTLSGVAAAGAPLSGSVTIKDSNQRQNRKRWRSPPTAHTASTPTA
jgi:ABC-type thiamine transport system ATPase subunit